MVMALLISGEDNAVVGNAWPTPHASPYPVLDSTVLQECEVGKAQLVEHRTRDQKEGRGFDFWQEWRENLLLKS